MVRVSIESPATLCGSAPCALGAHRLRHRLDGPERRAHATFSSSAAVDLLVIAERQHLAADDLAGLVALAGDQQHVAGLKRRDGAADRLAAVADLADVRARRRAVEDGGADRRRIFAARIVVGDDDAVGALRRDRAHQRRACPCRGRRRRRTPRRARASHKAAAPRWPSPARRACARNRRTPARRCGRRPDRAGPWRPSATPAPRTPRSGAPPVAIASPAATSAFSTWKPPTSGSRN